jgi:hypothetical protein
MNLPVDILIAGQHGAVDLREVFLWEGQHGAVGLQVVFLLQEAGGILFIRRAATQGCRRYFKTRTGWSDFITRKAGD